MKGSNVLDIVSKNGQTALMLAVQKKDPEMVQMLIDAGATVDLTVHDGDYFEKSSDDLKLCDPNPDTALMQAFL